MNNNKQIKCYLYLRVSTEAQVDGYSLEAQEKRLIREAEYRDMKIVGTFVDAGKSGKNIAGRPEFQNMLSAIQENRDGAKYVLVFKLSRFGRTAADVLSSLQLMQDYGVELICVEDGIDSSKESGKLMISVLSAVAEIERENIQVQTMAGRIEKARQGKWNGGFAPYGYALKEGKLVIDEEEAEIIRLIYDKYTNTSMGAGAVAKWLNSHGYKKKLRQNGTVNLFSAHFVVGVLDNPVYCGKIAYGRRKSEKIEGKRNEYHMVKQKKFNVYDGAHEAIVSEEMYETAQAKRAVHSVKFEKVHSLDHEHVLSSILKCPICGSGMYGNVNRKKRKDGTYYPDSFYYVCKHRKMIDGHICTYRKQPPQDAINEEVEAIVKEAFSSDMFMEVMTNALAKETDVGQLNKELNRLKEARKKLCLAKSKLESQIDSLDVLDDFYDKKYEDLQKRLDKFYVQIGDLDAQINNTNKAIESASRDAITLEGMMKYIDALKEEFDIMPYDLEKQIMNLLLERVELFEERQPDGRYVKSVHFKIPVIYKGFCTDEVWWDSERHVETVILLSRKKPDAIIEIDLEMSELDLTKAEAKATYEEIKQYILDKFGIKVSTLYISQVKRDYGLIERTNYNVGSGKNPVPKVTDKKREMIIDALKHFKMID